jgi:hypothetical protein
MAQTGYTPILIYASGTASNVPSASNMISSASGAELALNYADGKLYFKNSAGNVTLLADSSKTTPVTTFSAGTTGLTPSTATSGAITLSGTLVAANGGTGQSSYTTGDILYASGSSAISKLAIGTNGYVMTSSGSAPQWSATSGITVGTATNLAGGATGSVPYQSSSGTTTFLAAGTNGYILTLSAGVPTWAANTGISTGKSIAMAMIFGG